MSVFVHLQPEVEFLFQKNVKHIFLNASYWENYVGGRDVYIYTKLDYWRESKEHMAGIKLVSYS